MLRVTGWCVGLFGTGAAIARAFPSSWVQPLVLLALGIAFLFVSRTGTRAARVETARLPARGPQPAPTPTPAPVPVEQSA
jgi:uncharacterized membrane protein